MKRICIPDYEYKERIAKAAKLIAAMRMETLNLSQMNNY